MAIKSKLVVTPKIYEIGVDITSERWTEIIMAVGDWYAEWRPNSKEPNVIARQTLAACLKGVKPSDPSTQWKGAELASLETRIRMACQYDIETMQPMRSKSAKAKARGEKKIERETSRRRRAGEDELIPDEVRSELRKSAKYGDDPRVFLSSAEAKNWADLKDSYIDQFPQLATVNAQAELETLCDLHIVNGRQRMKVLKGERVDPDEQAGTTKQIVDLKKALGIHPDQLRKEVEKQTGGSIGEMVSRFGDPTEHRELRQKFWLEELLMLWQMYMMVSPRGSGGGYQIDEIGFFGHTRCRTCECSHCGTRNVAGIAVTEVEQYLISQGVLEPIADASEAPTQKEVSSQSAIDSSAAPQSVDDRLLPVVIVDAAGT